MATAGPSENWPNVGTIGHWSEIKLDIIKEYAKAYSTIFHGRRQTRFQIVYVDAFAGAGLHESRTTHELVPGSPLNALRVTPPFKEFHLIDLDGDKVDTLKQLVGVRPDVHIYEGDCNDILLTKVFPQIRFEDFRRGLCLLDPYGLQLNWEVIQAAGRLGTIDLFLNFPIMDMNRNALWRNPEGVDDADIARMSAYWGDDSWRSAAYPEVPTMFGPIEQKAGNQAIAEAFRTRLSTVGMFKEVPRPLPMRNRTGAVLYYLFFASQSAAGRKIATDLFRKYRNR